MTQELDQGNWSLLTLSLVIEKYVLPTVPTTGAIFKDVTLREDGIIETICTEYVTEPS